ncbi:hypothetical protein ACQ4ZB_004641 [Serratia marcescens]
MTEITYSLDVAAEILGCQQKKLLTEWAKNTISMVMDFGDDTRGPLAHFFIDASTQPDRNEFISRFPGESPTSFFLRPLDAQQIKRDEEITDDQNRELLRQYGCSGFNIPHHLRDNAEIHLPDTGNKQCIIETDALIFGLWRVSYNDFNRQQVQGHFTITPYPVNIISGEIKATFTPSHHGDKHGLTKKNIRITEHDMDTMRKLLSHRPGNQQAQPPAEESQVHAKTHGGIERFALEREKILAAALYVAHHFPREAGKTFKSHASCIDKHSYLFWKDEPAPDPERVAKILSDATRTPDEWKILGGNAKSKK